MAVTQNPLVGRAKGSAMNFTMTTHKGKNVVKGKPLSVANPNTEKQKHQRQKFSYCVALARTLAVAITAGFVSFRNEISEFNAFMKLNLKTLFLHDVGSPLDVEWSNLIISKGSLTQSDFTFTKAANLVTVGWTNGISPIGNQATTDLVAVVVLDGNGKLLNPEIFNGITRENEDIQVTCPGTPATTNLYVYAFFVSANGQKSSDSVFMSL